MSSLRITAKDNPADCFLCSSPVPCCQNDANAAYLCGIADGIIAAQQHKDNVPLCRPHREQLAHILADQGLAPTAYDDLVGYHPAARPLPQ